MSELALLPKEVETLAQGVSIEKKNEVQTVLNHVFNGVSKMREQLDLVNVEDENDKVNMKLANSIRLGVRSVRLSAEKQFDLKREEVQTAMRSFKTEDALWLKAKQTMQILTKEIEETAKWKEDTKDRVLAERKELKTQTRLLQSQNFNPEIVRGDIEAMSDEMFDLFLKGIEQAHNDKIEAERLAEVERLAEIERKAEADRLAEIERLATIEAERQAKEKADAEAEAERKKQAEKLETERKENERLRAELEAKEAEKKAREKQLEADRLESERLAKIERDKQAKIEAEKQAEIEAQRKKELEAKNSRFEARKKILIDLGFEYCLDREYNFSLAGIWSCFYEQIYNFEDKEFIAYLSDINEAINKHAENARLQAELKAKQEAEQAAENARKEAEKLAQIEAEKAAKAPVKEKLNLWVDSFSIGSPVGLRHETAIDIQNKFEAFKQWAKKEIEKV